MSNNQRKASHLVTGKKGEDIACHHLQKLGYKIVSRNWRYRRYEIDIIAYEHDILVFVEVKTRKGIDYGQPADFVDWNKQKKIIRASEQYLHRSKHNGEIRYDIVSILLSDNRSEIEVIKDAFWSN